MPISQSVTGITEARQNITLNALSEGTLHLHSFNAQAVKKGDMIATITNAQRDNTIASLNATMKLLRREITVEKSKLQSAREMLKLGIISKNQLLDQQNSLQERQIRLNQTKTELQRLTLQNSMSGVRAPSDGYIENLLPDGSYVTYGQTVCKLTGTQVQIRLFVPPMLAKELHIGQKVKLNEQSNVTDAHITAIMPQSSDNLIDVIALPAQPLPVGLHLEAQIETARAKGWIIPKEAIVLVQNRPALFLIQEGRATLRFVTVEKDMIDKVLVTDHLQRDDKIALKNAYMLHDGAIVEVQQ
jgi:RND family efflux transporter MFP subunit